LQGLLDFSLGRAFSNECHEIIAQQNEGIICRTYYAPHYLLRSLGQKRLFLVFVGGTLATQAVRQLLSPLQGGR